MYRLVRFVIAFVFLLVAAVSSASNFRAADQVYLNIAGRFGNFKTDINISNLSSDPVLVTMLLVQGANTEGAPPQTNFPPIFLDPNERIEIPDIFRSLHGLQSGLGQVIFNACKQGADCTGTDVTGFRNIIVESRIYSVDAAGNTHGQDFPGLPWYSSIGTGKNINNTNIDTTNLDKGLVLGLSQNGNPGQSGTFRTNIGFANASQFSTAVLTARLFASSGLQIGVNTVTLGPLGQAQLPMATFFGTGFLDDGRADRRDTDSRSFEPGVRMHRRMPRLFHLRLGYRQRNGGCDDARIDVPGSSDSVDL